MDIFGKIQVDRQRKKETVVKVKVDKDYTFRDGIWDIVDACCEQGKVPDCSLPAPAPKQKRPSKGKVFQNIYYSNKPETIILNEALVDSHISRMDCD